jgi:hypothetical protein
MMKAILVEEFKKRSQVKEVVSTVASFWKSVSRPARVIWSATRQDDES